METNKHEDERNRGEVGDSLIDRLGMIDDVDVEFEPTRIELRVPEL